jgi:hypothetical protein
MKAFASLNVQKASAAAPSAPSAPSATLANEGQEEDDDEVAMAIALSMEESKNKVPSSTQESTKSSQDAADLAEATVSSLFFVLFCDYEYYYFIT